MSELPSNESLQSKKINQREYNFEEEMEQLEVSMISLVLQLKDAIVEGDYSSFLSDDTGGRMPTLVLKYISDIVFEKLKKESNKNKEKVKAFFLAAGRDLPEPNKEYQSKKYQEVINYLKKMNFGDRKILIITQFIDSGNTLKSIGAIN